MKVKVHVPAHIANQSHRQPDEEVEVQVTDTVENLKIKITLVYTSLDPERFGLTLNSRMLNNQEKMLDLLNQNQGSPQLLFIVSLDQGCCRLF